MFPHSGKRDRYWPEVENFFGRLPPFLFRQGTLLKNNLAIRYSDTGQFKDILSRGQDYPLLELHLWLLDDFGVPEGAARRMIEGQVMAGMALAFGAGYAHQCLLDPASPFDNRLIFLEQALARQSARHFARLFPAGSPFWDYHRAFWEEYAEPLLEAFRPAGSPWPEPAESALRPDGRRLAPAKIPVAAVALKAGRTEALPRLLAMVDALNAIFQARQEILSIRYDLERGRPSYPIARTMAEAGIDPRGPASPERVLGAAILTGSLGKICRESLASLENCRREADGLGLPAFLAYFDRLEGLIRQVMALFSFGPKVAAAAGAPAPTATGAVIFAGYEDPLPRALTMAEGYLLADPTFRESWEVQRGGPFDVSEMTAAAFPGGLIVEILGRHGHDVSSRVAEIYRTARDNRFQYYDYLPAALPDADDLGLLLRLFRYSPHPDRHRAWLREPLGWMARSILPSGQIPVWFRPDPPPTSGREDGPAVLIWGNSCAATEINLLLGLLDYDPAAYREIIERSALGLLERLDRTGLGASLYYQPPYTLWVALRLAFALNKPASKVGAKRLKAATAMLLERLALEARRPPLSVQTAAFLTLACLSHPRARPLFEPGWITLLLKRQRYDGSWDDEPLYLVPDRNRSAWYSSRSVTTAFCYHALKNYSFKR